MSGRGVLWRKRHKRPNVIRRAVLATLSGIVLWARGSEVKAWNVSPVALTNFAIPLCRHTNLRNSSDVRLKNCAVSGSGVDEPSDFPFLERGKVVSKNVEQLSRKAKHGPEYPPYLRRVMNFCFEGQRFGVEWQNYSYAEDLQANCWTSTSVFPFDDGSQSLIIPDSVNKQRVDLSAIDAFWRYPSTFGICSFG